MSHRRQRGFTLLEVIVAFALLALALTLLLGSLSGAARQVRGAEYAGRAALHAQSLLAQLGSGEALQAGQRDGEWEQGRYHWQLQVEPFVDPARAAAPVVDPGGPRLMQLQLDVRWGEAKGESLRIRTLRRVAGAQEATP